MGLVIDLLGMSFNRLTVTGRGPNNRHKRAQWYCVCSCGNQNEVLVESWLLRSGNTKSCGCVHRENLQVHVQNCWKHGYACRGNQGPQYRAWTKARSAGKTQLAFLEFLNQQESIRAASTPQQSFETFVI